MGKAEIISYLGGGLYQIKILFDIRKLDAEISRLNAAIAAVEQKISGTFSPPSPPLEGKLLELAKLEKAALEKKKKYLENNSVADITMSAWCADLTEDLTGFVGTIEVPGERNGGVNIQPGYDNYAPYDAERDGQLQKSIAGTPGGTFYNLAMLPGWQKWRPTYRYGTITALNGDSCDIDLEEATSSAQDLDVNQTDTLSNVPINYMDCDGEAFDIGDAVIVEFIEQDWSRPQVIGFKSDPEYIRNYFTILTVYGPLPLYGSIRLAYIYPDGVPVLQVEHNASTLPAYAGQSGAYWTWPEALFWWKNKYVYFCTRDPSVAPPEVQDFYGIFIDTNGQIIEEKLLANMNAYEYGQLVGYNKSPREYYVLFRRAESARKDNWLAIYDQNLSLTNAWGIGFGWYVPEIVDPFKPLVIEDYLISVYDCGSGMTRFADGTCLWWRNGWDSGRILAFKYINYILDEIYGYIADPAIPVRTFDMSGTYNHSTDFCHIYAAQEGGDKLMYSVWLDYTNRSPNGGTSAELRLCNNKNNPASYTVVQTGPYVTADGVNYSNRYLKLAYLERAQVFFAYFEGIIRAYYGDYLIVQPYISVFNMTGVEIYRVTYSVFSSSMGLFGTVFS
jgi:hypothetical protein